MEALYPDEAALRDSTLVARINGCLAGYCRPEDIESEWDSYGLTPAGKEALWALARAR
jgi:hypothetical protein